MGPERSAQQHPPEGGTWPHLGRAWTGTILLLRAPKWSPEREGTPQLQATSPPARPAPANLPFRPVGTQHPAPSSSSRKPGPPRLTRGSGSSPPRAHGRSSSWTGSSPRGSGTDWGQFPPASSPPQLPGAPPGLSGAAMTSPVMGKLSSGAQPRPRVDVGHQHLILTAQRARMGGPHWAATPTPSCRPPGLHTFCRPSHATPHPTPDQQEASHLLPQSPGQLDAPAPPWPSAAACLRVLR